MDESNAVPSDQISLVQTSGLYILEYSVVQVHAVCKKKKKILEYIEYSVQVHWRTARKNTRGHSLDSAVREYQTRRQAPGQPTTTAPIVNQ